MLTCYDVANYLIYLAHQKGSDVCHLKLQKLAYYAQGLYLGLYDKPLFSEQIEAWPLGPVAPDLYHCYKSYGSKAIPLDNVNFSAFTKTEIIFLDWVYETLGGFHAFKLKAMTHKEDPWIEAIPTKEITQQSMKIYFKEQLRINPLFSLSKPSSIKDDLDSLKEGLDSSRENSDPKKSKAFRAFLDSVAERKEVYRRLADS